MINPDKITNFNLTKLQLEEVLMFWLCVAGKTAKTIAKALEKFLLELHDDCGYLTYKTPFELIKHLPENEIATRLRKNGIGCHKNKAKGLKQLANSGLDLTKCSINDLEEIHGIGPKTARCFILHSRKDAQCVGLDTHILHFMRDLGFDVPKSTPGSKKQYMAVEKQFLKLVKMSRRSIADLDLTVWRVYSQNYYGALLN